MKKKSKKIHLNKLIIIRSIFVLIFIASLFSTINAFANTNPFKIIDAVISDKSDGVIGDIEDFNSSEVTDNIKFYKLDDSVTYKLTLKNTRDNEIKILSISDDNSNDYLVYDYDKLENKVINANEEFEFVFKVVYKNELLDTSKRDQINNVNFNINYLEDDKYVQMRLGLNPNTGDNINISLIILGISTCGLIYCFTSKKNKKKKLLILVIGFMGLPLFVNALNATLTLKLNSNFGLYDKVIITYNSAGDSHNEDSNYNEVINNLENPTPRDGYNFVRWEVNGEEFNPRDVLTDDITLDAKWELINYPIIYNLVNGTLSNPNREEYSIEDEFTLNNPSRDGYKFIGWSGTDLDEVTKNVVVKNKFGNREYTANWSPVTYSISYEGLEDEEEELLGNDTSYTILDTVSLAEPTFRYDSDGDKTFKFVGWEDEDGTVSTNVRFSNSFGDKVFTAKWESVAPNNYSITYNLNGGSGENPTSFTKHTTTFTLNEPERDGYTFTGWSGTDLDGDSNKNVKVNKGTRKNLEFTAHWSPITYAINYDLNGGSGSNTTSYTIEDRVVINNPTRDNYNFVGWSGTGLSQTTKDLVLEVGNFGIKNYTANWEAVPYNITYNLNGGSVNGNPETYTVLSNITLNRPVKVGYTFLGWLDADEGEPVLDYSISEGHSGDITLNAVWQANTYEVIFNGNGNDGDTSMPNQEFTYDVEDNLSSNIYTKEGMVFKEWNTEPDGSGTSYSNEALVSNLAVSGVVTLYAQWNEPGAMFTNGISFKSKIVSLTDDNQESSIKAFAKSSVEPDNSIKNAEHLVSIDDDIHKAPIYAWFDNGTIYWWSPVENPQLNPDSSYMLGYLSEIENVDFSGIDTSESTNMSYLFAFDKKLKTINLGNDFDTSKVTNMSYMFNENNVLETLDLGDKFDTSNVTTMYYMFSNCNALTSLDLGDKFDTSKVVSMASLFDGLRKLETLDLGDKFDTSNVKNMNRLFNGMYVLKSLDLGDKFDTSNVTSMNDTFAYLKTVDTLDLGDKFNTSNVTSMSGIFSSLYEITTLDLGDKFYTNKVRDMSNMFYNCNKLKSIDLGEYFDTSEVTNMNYMFYMAKSLESLDLGKHFNTSNVKKMSSMFYQCVKLETLDLGDKFDTSNVTTMAYMFRDCNALKSLNLGNKFNTSKVTTFREMFSNCKKLESLNLTDNFNTISATTMYEMFNHCTSLKTLNLGSNFDTRNVTSMSHMFAGCYVLQSLDLGDKFDTSKVTAMDDMFSSVYTITSLNLGSKFDTSNVTTMNNMFSTMSNVQVLNLGSKFNTSKVTNVMNMFNGDIELVTIYAPTFNTSSIKDSYGIFISCNKLVGGKGTKFSKLNDITIARAKVDGGTSNPGYFTQP